MLQEMESATLVIVHPRAPMVLAMRDRSGSPVLPEVQIPRFTRLAEEATGAIREKWGLASIALFRPELTGAEGQALVLTLCGPAVTAGGGLEWWSAAEFPGNALVDRAVQQLTRYEDRDLHGPFCRRQWISELESWVADCIRPLGLHLTGRLRQYNCGATFALVRFETHHSAVWFKASGEPNRHEFAVTREVSYRAPEFVPRTIAFHEGWNGWLMREAAGQPIDVCNRPEAWTRAASALSTIQMRFAGLTGLLRSIGCRDRSLEWIESKLDPFFQSAEEWMSHQPAGTASQPLTPSELRDLKARVRVLLAELRALHIDESLVHGDINPGNLIVSPGGCTFLDWAEAWIGHPFVSFEYFRELLRKTHPDRPGWLYEVQAAYSAPWRDRYGTARVDHALRISPAIAPLAYAMGAIELPVRFQTLSPRQEAFLRSLVRRIDREARDHGEAAA